MDEQFVMELTEDLDHMRQLLERCVRKLRMRMSDNPDIRANAGKPALPMAVEDNGIRAEIEAQRRAIMAQVEQAKAQAVAAATAAGRPIGMGGMSGMPGMGSMDPETLKELQRKLAAERNTDKSEGVEKSDSAGPVLKT